MALRDKLLARLESIKMPANALDLITCHFGVEHVAEMTGRKMRFAPLPGGGSRWEPRSSHGERERERERARERDIDTPPTPLVVSRACPCAFPARGGGFTSPGCPAS